MILNSYIPGTGKSSGGFIVQSTPPEDTNLLWIDTSVGGVMKYYDSSSSQWKGILGVWG